MACVQRDDDVTKGQTNEADQQPHYQQSPQQQQQQPQHHDHHDEHDQDQPQPYELSVEQVSVVSRQLKRIADANEYDDSSLSPPNDRCNGRWSANMPPLGLNGKPLGWMDGLLGCMRPVMSLLVKSSSTDVRDRAEEWEIPFESITNLEWLGSGAQGTVFSGYIRNEIVAVKKVRDYKETDIKHLRRLDHENIIKFK